MANGATRKSNHADSTALHDGSALYVGELVGSVMLISGAIAGLYVAAVSLTLLAAYSVSGAWLLVVGAHDEQGAASRR